MLNDLLFLNILALRTTIKHPTYFGRVSFALNGAEQEKDLKIPPCTSPCAICDGTEKPDPQMPHHWQADFTHCIGKRFSSLLK